MQKKLTLKTILQSMSTQELILNYAANRVPKKYDYTIRNNHQIRQLKPYKPHYILADRAYDTETIRKCINEEVGAFDQIPLKTRAKTWNITD